MLLPDDWSRYPVGEEPDRSADRFLQRHLPQIHGDGRDAVLARRRAQSDTAGAFHSMADIGAVDLYFFDGLVDGVPMNMMFTVGVVYLGPIVAEIPLRDLAPALGYESVEIACGPAMRSAGARTIELDSPAVQLPEHVTVTADQADRVAELVAPAHIEIPEQRVDYLVPVPGEPGVFASVAFRTIGGDHVVAKSGHFDILMNGFDWMAA